MGIMALLRNIGRIIAISYFVVSIMRHPLHGQYGLRNIILKINLPLKTLGHCLLAVLQSLQLNSQQRGK
ncbi:hypothetical protein BJJ97_13255 [Pectobacterium polaris]|nr:hypothetical protein BJJ97_13255 [Pectobacterium polaris]